MFLASSPSTSQVGPSFSNFSFLDKKNYHMNYISPLKNKSKHIFQHNLKSEQMQTPYGKCILGLCCAKLIVHMQAQPGNPQIAKLCCHVDNRGFSIEEFEMKQWYSY
jgi:hypothetical protein